MSSYGNEMSVNSNVSHSSSAIASNGVRREIAKQSQDPPEVPCETRSAAQA